MVDENGIVVNVVFLGGIAVAGSIANHHDFVQVVAELQHGGDAGSLGTHILRQDDVGVLQQTELAPLLLNRVSVGGGNHGNIGKRMGSGQTFLIEDAIATYNDGVDELSQINYTDYVGLMMSSVTAIINAITYVLIAFVAVSLIVSSIMIGVITLISVQERTKEIGVLRAIGASKKNVSNMFNAETVIIGFTSGTLGVLITKLLCIPINTVLHHLTGITNLNAHLPWQVALILIEISVLLTLIAGVIPSRSAAKKDPVVALRSE